MKKIFFLILAMMISLPVWADDFLAKKQVELGKPVADFMLQDIEGSTVKLSDFKGKVVMLHFWSAKCPFVVRYKNRLQSIASDYKSKGVVVFGIDSNSNETLEQIKAVANERKENYPLLLDPENKIADQFGAVTTPHVFLINKEGQLAYEGAVDDQGWSEDKEPTQAYVRLALDELLADKPVTQTKTKTAGCTIKRVS